MRSDSANKEHERQTATDEARMSPDPPESHATDSHSRTEARSVDGDETSERPAKRLKRGKYVARACVPCQKRKIKCEGGSPCPQCIHRRREPLCVTTAPASAQHQSADSQVPYRMDSDAITRAASQFAITDELLRRLSTVERQLKSVLTSRSEAQTLHGGRGPTRSDDQNSPGSLTLQKVLESDGQTFAGETSISHAFDRMDDTWQDAVADACTALSPSSPNDSVIPNGSNAGRVLGTTSKRPRSWLQSHLDAQGLVADEAEWESYLHNMMDHVHILYPCLHPPAVWDSFRQLWEYGALWTLTDSVEREQKRIQLAVVFFCLALGRCTGSSRLDDANGVHSSGWTLYSVGLSLLGDIMDISNNAAKSLTGMQALLLMVLYLFRLDANQRAERILAVVITNAHIVGLNRHKTLDRMPVYQDQICRRLWWSIYVIDRRLALEAGRPFLIQDSNVDTNLPDNLSDDWLSQKKLNRQTSSDLADAIRIEITADIPSCIPYLVSMIKYSRVVGKAWEIMYGVKSADQMPSPAMTDYIETMLARVESEVSHDLRCDPHAQHELQFADRAPWQTYLSILTTMRFNFLRLLIRRPTSRTPDSRGDMYNEELENATTCTRLAAGIIRVYCSMPHTKSRYTFPLSHYLTSAVMILLSLVLTRVELRSQYGELIIIAVRALNNYCHNTWVSGKMMRSVAKLSVLVQANFKEALATGAGQDTSRNIAFSTQRPSSDRQAEALAVQSGPLTPISDSAISANTLFRSRADAPVMTQKAQLPESRQTKSPARGGQDDENHISRTAPIASNAMTARNARSTAAETWSPSRDLSALEPLNIDLPSWAMSDFAFESFISSGNADTTSNQHRAAQGGANTTSHDASSSRGTPANVNRNTWTADSAPTMLAGDGLDGFEGLFLDSDPGLSFLDPDFLNEQLRAQGFPSFAEL